MKRRSLTELVVESGTNPGEYGLNHAWVTVYGPVREDELAEAFGKPTEAERLAAVVYLSGILARLALKLHDEVEGDRTVHGCGRPLYWRDPNQIDKPPRRIQRGGKAEADEVVSPMYSDTCEVESETWDLGKNEAAPEVTFSIPPNRRKYWVDRISSYLEQMAVDDQWLP